MFKKLLKARRNKKKSLKAKVSEMEENCNRLAVEKEILQEAFSAKELEWENNNQSLQTKIGGIQNNFAKLAAEKQHLQETLLAKEFDWENKNQSLQTKVGEIMESLTKLAADKEQLLETFSTQELDWENRNKSFEVKNETLERMAKDIILSREILEEQINHYRDENKKLSDQLSSAQNEMQNLKAFNITLSTANASLTDQMGSLIEEVGRLRGQNEELVEKNDELAENYAELMGHGNHRQKIKHVVNLKNEILIVQKENNELRSKNAKLTAENSSLHNQLTKIPGVASKFDRSQAFKKFLKEPFTPDPGDVRGGDSRQTFAVSKKSSPQVFVRPETAKHAGQGIAFDIDFDYHIEN